MSGVNKAIIIGNLGADPDLRYTASGAAVVTMSLATSRRYTGNDGNVQEDTQWHKIVVWGKTAEACKNHLFKGRQAYVEGRLQTRQWEDRDGNKRWTTEIVAEKVQFLGGKYGSDDGNSGNNKNGGKTHAGGGASYSDDDIPF